MTHKELMDKQLSAYHEAGHAVTAYFMGLRFESVSIDIDKSVSIDIDKEDDFNAGRVTTDEYLGEDLSIIRKHGIVIYGGWLAEISIDPGWDGNTKDGWIKDSMNLQKLLQQAYQDKEHQQSYRQNLEAEARKLISSDKWKIAIKALADALLEHKYLGYADAKQVIKNSVL